MFLFRTTTNYANIVIFKLSSLASVLKHSLLKLNFSRMSLLHTNLRMLVYHPFRCGVWEQKCCLFSLHDMSGPCIHMWLTSYSLECICPSSISRVLNIAWFFFLINIINIVVESFCIVIVMVFYFTYSLYSTRHIYNYVTHLNTYLYSSVYLFLVNFNFILYFCVHILDQFLSPAWRTCFSLDFYF